MFVATQFVWGLKRSGNHLVVNWLYANHGGSAKDPLDTTGLDPQLHDGYCDRSARVAFYNNCGGLRSRAFHIGHLGAVEFEVAARPYVSTIFGIEDCELQYADRLPRAADVGNVLILRDPLNNVASRLEGALTRPEVFRVDRDYVTLMASYCDEYLGRTNQLGPKVLVNYNDFIGERAYRDSLADAIGSPNLDAVDEVSAYGGGSSFANGTAPGDQGGLLTRFRQHPIPDEVLGLLLDAEPVRTVCAEVFGYDLAEVASAQ